MKLRSNERKLGQTPQLELWMLDYLLHFSLHMRTAGNDHNYKR